MAYQSLSNMWRNEFYEGRICNSLLEETYIKGNWEPLISKTEFNSALKPGICISLGPKSNMLST